MHVNASNAPMPDNQPIRGRAQAGVSRTRVVSGSPVFRFLMPVEEGWMLGWS
jgi:hypothetical protein